MNIQNIHTQTICAIDFETAYQQRNTPCRMGIVYGQNGTIIKSIDRKIKPPGNKYHYMCTKVHGMTWKDTKSSPNFDHFIDEIKQTLSNKIIIAHNVSFDKSVLVKSLADYNLTLTELGINTQWICTLKLVRKIGFHKVSLDKICEELKIKLNHHDALSDARASYLIFNHIINNNLIDIKEGIH